MSEPFAAGSASRAIGMAIRNVELQIICFGLCMGSRRSNLVFGFRPLQHTGTLRQHIIKQISARNYVYFMYIPCGPKK